MMELEKNQYIDFKKNWEKGNYKALRFGQAFYEYFKLHKSNSLTDFDNLYNVETKEEALKIIHKNFLIR